LLLCSSLAQHSTLKAQTKSTTHSLLELIIILFQNREGSFFFSLAVVFGKGSRPDKVNKPSLLIQNANVMISNFLSEPPLESSTVKNQVALRLVLEKDSDRFQAKSAKVFSEF